MGERCTAPLIIAIIGERKGVCAQVCFKKNFVAGAVMADYVSKTSGLEEAEIPESVQQKSSPRNSEPTDSNLTTTNPAMNVDELGVRVRLVHATG